ncbi:MAG: DUF1116 domain-containing protein [Planctomycetota bacterium]|jgi:hypothetical protein|nr:DUF1116 domain-containing protein [Planctomycetota bacterium]
MTNKLQVAVLGVDVFDAAFAESDTPYTRLDWKPPAGGDAKLVDALFRLETECVDDKGDSLIDRANREAFDRLRKGRPVLKRVRPAHEVIAGLDKETILHAGPPIAWADMCGPMRGAFVGAVKYEGLAKDDAGAETLLASGKIKCRPNHHHRAVGPMTGMISHSMPVFVVENEPFGNQAFCPVNEGIGKVMRFGANDESVIANLRWIETVLAPAIDQALVDGGGVDLKVVMAQSLAMGDEMHQRNVAASLNFHKAVAGGFHAALSGNPEGRKAVEFVAGGNEQFFLNLAMASCKAIMDPLRGIPYSTVVTAMSRNGVDFGINVSDLEGEWFTAPCLKPQALYFPGFSEADANPDMGDSAIVECFGIGGMAMGAAPAVVRFVGAGGAEDAYRYTRTMREIAVGPNPDLPIPGMDFIGIPSAIDIRRVVATGIMPVINTGVAHRLPGVGQVGAGIVTPPMEIMRRALSRFAEKRLGKCGR